jgi:hypothetical protein
MTPKIDPLIGAQWRHIANAFPDLRALRKFAFVGTMVCVILRLAFTMLLPTRLMRAAQTLYA